MDASPASAVGTEQRPRVLRSLTGMMPFILVHLACLGAIWTGVSYASLALCAGLYLVRMFGVTGGYHRYFSHRTYRMGRVMQFLMAFLAQSSAQKGVLWWAAHHRHHHRHSDEDDDVHSPRRDGVLYAHMGWVLSPNNDSPDLERVADLARYPELRWLSRWHLVPPILLGAAVFLLGGAEMLVVGFLWSTVLLWHGTFTINSLSHVFGKQPYATGDDSRNNFLLALITLGEGWHNNHHYHQACTRQGFRWWQIDITYYLLRLLAVCRLVRGLKPVPARVVEKGYGRRERVAVTPETDDEPAPAAA